MLAHGKSLGNHSSDHMVGQQVIVVSHYRLGSQTQKNKPKVVIENTYNHGESGEKSVEIYETL